MTDISSRLPFVHTGGLYVIRVSTSAGLSDPVPDVLERDNLVARAGKEMMYRSIQGIARVSAFRSK